MTKTHHIATVTGRPIAEPKESDVVYEGETLKLAVEKLNNKFVELRKGGEMVERTSISEFIHTKK